MRFGRVRWGRVVVLLQLALLSVLLSVSFTSMAHEARPISIGIVEITQGTFSVSLIVPSSLPVNGMPRLAMPQNCGIIGEPVFSQDRSRYHLKGQYHCPQGLPGYTLGLKYPGSHSNANALFRISLLSGEKYTQLLSPTERQWRVPQREEPWQVAQQYTGLGINHILGGIDHLLFIACLIFIAATWKRILITVTGFTIAHSLTLFLSALEVVVLPVPPVEAVIALSIIFLAHEIVLQRKNSWTWRYPIAVSSSFGLLHGFGFAAVLGEIGLPQTELFTALLSFNLGVEIGQLAFIFALAAIAIGVKKLFSRELLAFFKQPRTSLAGGYMIGTLAAYWFIVRLSFF